MRIRCGTAADLEDVQSIVERAYARYVPRIGCRPAPMDADYPRLLSQGVVHLVVDGDAVRGLIDLRPQPDHLLIGNVAVDPLHHGRGYGRALLQHAEAEARRLARPQVRLYTNAAMTENIRMYLRIGYTEVDRQLVDGFERVFFVKPL